MPCPLTLFPVARKNGGMLHVEAIPALKDNYIWALVRDTACVVVDPGEAAPILAWLQDTGTRLAAVLVTHHHRDHVGGIRELVDRFPVPVYGPAKESIAEVTHPVAEGQVVALPDLGAELRVLEVPGHTRGHVAYYGHGHLFCGDTLFGCGCGRLFEGSPEEMHASLARLAALPEDTRVCCAHEYTLDNIAFALQIEPANPELAARARRDRARRRRGEPTLPSDIATEKATNPFLRCGEAAVVRSAQAHAGQDLRREADVFRVVREMKDRFRQ